MRSLIYPLLLAIGLLAPGWLLGRALRAPAGLPGALLGSAAILVNLILGLDALGVSLTASHLAPGLAIVCAALAIIARRRRATTLDNSAAAPRRFRWQPHHWILLPAAAGLGAIALRASLDPLSGFDTMFRWDFLARQMWQEGNLGFYPAVHADDFLRYGWPDGIAPLVSSLYFWSYLSAGAILPAATIPVVFGQAIILFTTVGQLASCRGGPAAGALAVSVLATSSVLLWGVAIGQETGLTALSLVAMFVFLERHRAAPDLRWLIWAGVAAGTGALAREYGLAYLAFGGVALAWQRAPRRDHTAFFVSAALVALPWYARNAWRTGNPLYSHALGGLFPANPIGVEYLQAVSDLRGPGSAAAPWTTIAWTLALLTAVPLGLGLAGTIRARRECGPWIVAILGVGVLWVWSIPQTSGGLVYSLRVLTPALALAAVLGGLALAQWTAPRHRWWLALLLAVPAVDAGERSLFLPIDPEVAWWRWRASAWRDFGRLAEWWNRHPDWAALATASGPQQILVCDPYHQVSLLRVGAKPVSFFSPAVSFLFAPNADFAACLARLRAAQTRFLLVPSRNDIVERLLARHSFFRTLQAAKPTAASALFLTYDLASPDLTGTIPPPAYARPPHAP